MTDDGAVILVPCAVSESSGNPEYQTPPWWDEDAAQCRDSIKCGDPPEVPEGIFCDI